MPGAYNDMRPGGQPVSFSKFIGSGATDTLIWRVPWGNPVNKVFEPRKIIFMTTAGSGAAKLDLWDQDLSSSTPTKNGSAGAALLSVTTASGVGATVILDLNQCPQLVFQAGVTCQSSIISTFVAIEGQVY